MLEIVVGHVHISTQELLATRVGGMLLNLENVLLALREFLVVWTSQIIYYNRVYPENAFEKQNYLDVVVHKCRAPQVNEYLKQFANDMIGVLVAKNGGGKVHELVVLVYNEQNLHVTRRYIANFSQFVGLRDQITLLDFLRGGEVHLAKLAIPNLDWSNLHTHFRSLAFFHVEELKRLEPEGELFFKLLLNVDGDADMTSPAEAEASPWIRLTSDLDNRPHKFVPLGEMSVGFVCFDLHNEYVR